LIVTCEQCQARFRLDESRIPPGGTRVRCSRCKHAFRLAAPGPSGDLLEELIQETAAEPLKAPPPTEDLPEAEPPRRAGRGPGAPEEEESWEFSDRVPGAGKSEEPTPPPSALERLELDRGARATPSAEPADPGTWSFPEEESGELPELVSPPAAEVSAPRARPASESRGPSRALPERSTVAPRRVEARGARPHLWPVHALGWAVTGGLGLLVLARALAPLPQPAAAPARSLPAGALGAQALRGRFVENALEGPLLVVTGELVNPGPEPRAAGALLDVRLLGEAGDPLAAAAALGLDPGEPTLRESGAGELAALLEASGRELARTPLAPGASVPVAAVFAAVPPEAARFTLEARALPEGEPSAESEGGEPGDGATAAGAG
jgi:predicted Zn finger-like uncharacterized protein